MATTTESQAPPPAAASCPFASAIDTDLPVPPERTHLMLGARANWVEPEIGPQDRRFEAFPEEAIADWHQRLGLEDGDDD